MTNSWMQFSPGSPDYIGGAGGQTIPPWLQRSLGRATQAGGVGGGGTGGQNTTGIAPTDSSTSGAPPARGGQFSQWQNQQAGQETPDWFQHFQTQWLQNQQQALAQNGPSPAAAPAPTPATPESSAAPQSPVMGAGFNTPPQADQTPAPVSAASQATDPNAHAAVDTRVAPPAPPAPTAVTVQQPSYAGVGSPVTNGWYHNNDASNGGQYAGTGSDGQPVYFHFGNQSAEDQYKSQFPGQVPTQATPSPTPSPTPAPVAAPAAPSVPAVGAYTPAANSDTTPEALGGTQSAPDWVSNQQQLAAGFGSDIPEALGGTKKMARGGAVRGYANGGATGMGGLASAAQQVQSFGRGPDTMLAHISPDESKMIDYLQGGRKTNPMTGLPEYSMFGDVLKAVARAAGAIGGFAIGGPAGAALGAGAATKLTGGSWGDALKAGAMSGIGSFGAQGLTGGGWSLAKDPSLAFDTASMGNAVTAAGGQAPGAGLGAQFLNAAKSAPGISAGLGAISTPLSAAPAAAAMSSAPSSPINLNVKPQPRTFNPYTGDANKFAEVGADGKMAPGMGHTFYTPLLPIPQYEDPEVQGSGQPIAGLGYANGGRIRRFALGGAMTAGPQLPMVGAGVMDGPTMPGQPGGALMGPRMPGAGAGIGAPKDLQMRRAALAGYSMFAKGGTPHEGPVYGPGTGTSDSIPAMLSNGEHVMTHAEVSALGGGNNEAGQKTTYALRRAIKKNPAKVRAMVRGLGAA